MTPHGPKQHVKTVSQRIFFRGSASCSQADKTQAWKMHQLLTQLKRVNCFLIFFIYFFFSFLISDIWIQVSRVRNSCLWLPALLRREGPLRRPQCGWQYQGCEDAVSGVLICVQLSHRGAFPQMLALPLNNCFEES